MKTTLDLPNDLVQEIKLRVVNEGRKLKDVAAARRLIHLPHKAAGA